MSVPKLIAVMLALVCASSVLFAQTGTGSVAGLVTDPTSAVVPGAQVSLMRNGVQAAVTKADGQGHYSFSGVASGEYSLEILAEGFAAYEAVALQVGPGRTLTHNAKLTIAAMQQQVEVADSDARPIDVEASNNAGATVLKGEALEALSDDPDALAEDLQALAGPSAGPNGGEIFVDGFSGGKLPPKSSIREIRVNQNPFSAEFDRLGYGRIEILTKPGTDKFRGDAMFNFGDSIFNSRNPFAKDKPHSQRRMMHAQVSGPLSKRSSFSLNLERRDIEETSIINATILDSAFNPQPFDASVVAPSVNTEIGLRLDYQLNNNHTLVGRYEWEDTNRENGGLSTFTLPTRAYNSAGRDHLLQLTETAVLSPKAINEIRFQYRRGTNESGGLNNDSILNVSEAFSMGGVERSRGTDQRWEVTDIVSLSRDRHMIKFGGRLRGVSRSDYSEDGYNGAFSFAGRMLGEQLITALEAYRITEMGLRDGLTMAEIRAMGGGATQFSLTAGDPNVSVSQVDGSLFFQDDWRIKPQFTINTGLRYELQNNIGDRRSIAPRVGFAWAPGGQSKPIAVIRGGFGIFYERLRENLTMEVNRLNGVRQQQYQVNDPDFYPNIPPIELLQGAEEQQVVRIVAPNIRSPYIMQTALSVERQLPKNITVSLTYTNSRGVHSLRSRNINAPLPGSYDPDVPDSGVRPFPGGNIYMYESAGVFRQNQFIVNVNGRISRRVNFFGFYTFGKAESNTDGSGSFPVDQYDLSTEYGRAGYDVRHRMFLGGSLNGPYGVSLSPFIVVNSGAPFNITIGGRDFNGDGRLNERPAWATDLTRPSVVVTEYGAFDTDVRNLLPGQTLIPRNLGTGPGSFTVNMRLSKTFGFGKREGSETPAAAPTGGMPPMPPPGGGRGGHGGHGRGGFGGGGWGGASNSRYSLTFSVSARNLLNTVNLGSPIGSLSAGDRFGTSVALGGFGHFGSSSANRVVEFQTRFSF
ncbi:MAG TPA: carboxypeptidase regulatory-like domain-containing protein [Terriglobales bacterium]|nr:carboxypeptidase regulatory-like domain-containing protein [Terriglobales bacterium]